MKKQLVTQIKPNPSTTVEWDGRPDNVCQTCGYHTCCCSVQNAYKAKGLRLVKLAIFAALFMAQSVGAQCAFSCQTASDSTIQAICGTTTPRDGYYADEYGQIWDVWCPIRTAILREDGSFTKLCCLGYCASRVDLSPIRKLPTKLTAVKSTGKYSGA